MSNNPGKAIAKQPWDAKRVGNLLLNNALDRKSTRLNSSHDN